MATEHSSGRSTVAVLQKDWDATLQLWWAITWRSALIGGLAGAILAIPTTIVLLVLGSELDSELVGEVLGGAAGILGTLLSVRWLLAQGTRNHTIHMVPRTGVDAA